MLTFILRLISILLAILLILLIICEDKKFSTPPKIELQKKMGEDFQLTFDIPELDQLNEKNKKLTSFVCEDVKISTWKKGINFKLNGKIYFEKEKNLKFVVNTRFSKELEIGSNENSFWYWSKRDREPALYFAAHEDLQQTRLKPLFNPQFIIGSLGFNEIKHLDKAAIIRSSTHTVLTWRINPATGEIVNWAELDEATALMHTIYIDSTTNRIVGTNLSKSDKSIATTEVKEFDGDIPKKILFVWDEEGESLMLEFTTPVINPGLDEHLWELPSIQPRINMANE